MIDKITDQSILQTLLDSIKRGLIAPQEFLQVRRLADRLVQERYVKAVELKSFSTLNEGFDVKQGTVENQLDSLDTSPAKRRGTILMEQVLASPELQDRIGNLRVLIVGPRTEIEYFHAISLGLRPENVTCVDLISYSPYCETMDAHSLKYNDAIFDIVIHGWVLPYSKNYWIMITEALRVLKHGGILSIGFNSEAFALPGVQYLDHFDEEFPVLSSAQRLIDSIQSYVEEIVFSNGPSLPRGVMGQKCHLAVKVNKIPHVKIKNAYSAMAFEKSLADQLYSPKSSHQHLVQAKLRDQVNYFYGLCNFGRILPRTEGEVAIHSPSTLKDLTDNLYEHMSFDAHIPSPAVHQVFSGSVLNRVQQIMGLCPLFLGILQSRLNRGEVMDILTEYINRGGCIVFAHPSGSTVSIPFFNFMPKDLEFKLIQLPSNVDLNLYPRLSQFHAR